MSRITRLTASTLAAITVGAAAPAATPAQAAPVNAPAATAAAPAQWRSLWVDAFNDGIGSPAQVSRLVADAKSAGVNVLIVQVARRYDCACNTSTLPRLAAMTPAPYDPLAEVVRQGHAAGLQVHAWMNATTLWSSAKAPAAPTHAFNRHGFAATGADRWLNRRIDGTERSGNNVYIDPGNPAAVRYFADAVASVQRNYDVDGINLDYIRYPDTNATRGNDWGYTPTALARFAAATGRKDVPRPDDPQWSQWRRDQVTGIVKAVRTRMLAQDPRDRLSINGITWGGGPSQSGGWTGTATYTAALQDFRGWMASNLIDTVTAMNYKRSAVPAHAAMFSSWVQGLADIQRETGKLAVSGNGLYLNDLPGNLAQAREAVGAGLGWSGYAYSGVSIAATDGTRSNAAEFAALATRLRGDVFSSSARVPGLGRSAAPVTAPRAPAPRPAVRGRSAVRGTVLWGRTPKAGVTVSVRAAGASTLTWTARTDRRGRFAVSALPAGRFVVRVADARYTSTARTVAVKSGRSVVTVLGATRR